jgi:hypothetical protein
MIAIELGLGLQPSVAWATSFAVELRDAPAALLLGSTILSII